ncbi:Uncharacterised protein [Escherichia coli]|uniref:Uncharacterized protein n=1 Tax=Escherichia coli TaxID=562 RepID=A0A2X3JRI0_ECOLX|nr:Uncharacterised protein [Escherichia coli]
MSNLSLKNKNILVNKFTELLSDSSFDDAVTIGTNSRSKVNTRFQLANEILWGLEK